MNSPNASDKNTNNDLWKSKSIYDNYGNSNNKNSWGNNSTSFTLEMFNYTINEGKINNKVNYYILRNRLRDLLIQNRAKIHQVSSLLFPYYLKKKKIIIFLNKNIFDPHHKSRVNNCIFLRISMLFLKLEIHNLSIPSLEL